MPTTTGYLTTHVLDTALGVPAAGMPIELFKVEDETHQSICHVLTNADGRTDSPILPNDQFSTGIYELIFDVETYRAVQIGDDAALRFFDKVPIRFRISDPNRHYHVPLLISPFGYSTYRGS